MNEKQLKILKLGMNECGVSYDVVETFYETSPTYTLKKLVEQDFLRLDSPGMYYTTNKGINYIRKILNVNTEQQWIKN